MLLRRREFLGSFAAGATAWAVREASAAPQTVAQTTKPHGPAAAQRGDPWLEINTANLVWNLRQIQNRIGDKKLMAVVKANAYGHGLVGVARVLWQAGIRHFLVAKVDEASKMRAAGIRGRILNFGPFSDADAAEIVRLDISQNVYSEQVRALDRAAQRLGRKAHVHIKVDTGLGRVGVHHERAVEFIAMVAGLRSVAVEGVFTTFTEDPDFDAVQLARLKDVCARATQRGHSVGLRHAASSAAILDFPAAVSELDMVRPGIMLYGLYPSTRAEKERKLDLKPVMSLKCRVAQVKTLRAGESLGYHRVFTASQPEPVATLAVGYSDGLPRTLAGKGSTLLAGRRCAILAISSNATLVRLGDTPAAAGDEGVLIGTQGSAAISASEVAELTGNSVYGVVMAMSALLPQVSPTS
jgi:alanine racemase